MKAEEMFERACEAWGIEVRSDTQVGYKDKRYLYYRDQPLDVVWCPEVAQDLAALHGEEAVQGLVYALLDRTIRAMLHMPLASTRQLQDGVHVQLPREWAEDVANPRTPWTTRDKDFLVKTIREALHGYETKG